MPNDYRWSLAPLGPPAPVRDASGVSGGRRQSESARVVIDFRGWRCFRNLHRLAVPSPDHGADPPIAVAFEELDAVDAAVDYVAVAGPAGFVGAEDVGDIRELVGLAPDLPFPEAGQDAGIDHRFEVPAEGFGSEFEYTFVVHAYKARIRNEDVHLAGPVGTRSRFERNHPVHFGDHAVDAHG